MAKGALNARAWDERMYRRRLLPWLQGQCILDNEDAQIRADRHTIAGAPGDKLAGSRSVLNGLYLSTHVKSTLHTTQSEFQNRQENQGKMEIHFLGGRTLETKGEEAAGPSMFGGRSNQK